MRPRIKKANPDFLIRYNLFSSKQSSAKVSSLENKTKQKKDLEAVKTKVFEAGGEGEAKAGHHVTVVKTDLHLHGEWAPRAGEAGLISEPGSSSNSLLSASFSSGF